MAKLTHKTFLRLVFMLVAVQLSCYAPRQTFQVTPSFTVEVQVPPMALRNQSNTFTVKAVPESICKIVFGYWNKDDRWVGTSPITKFADTNGICEFSWKIPEDAKNGEAEIRGFVEAGNESVNFSPRTFCVEKCP